MQVIMAIVGALVLIFGTRACVQYMYPVDPAAVERQEAADKKYFYDYCNFMKNHSEKLNAYQLWEVVRDCQRRGINIY